MGVQRKKCLIVSEEIREDFFGGIEIGFGKEFVKRVVIGFLCREYYKTFSSLGDCGIRWWWFGI